jgi:hypothetical protein
MKGAYSKCFSLFKEVQHLKIKVFTYGSPLVIYDSTKHLKKLAKNTYNVVNDYDIVPKLLANSRFKHYGTYFWLHKRNLTPFSQHEVLESKILNHEISKVFSTATFFDHASNY